MNGAKQAMAIPASQHWSGTSPAKALHLGRGRFNLMSESVSIVSVFAMRLSRPRGATGEQDCTVRR